MTPETAFKNTFFHFKGF